ncbi:carbonyl reductase [Hyaloraphidium curvatum]|nr:carbonyl reductase [Hyaloraphidium curvatum]
MLTYIVTGANQGIGLACVRQLALRAEQPSTIYLTARNADKGLKALADLKGELAGKKVLAAEGGKADIVFHQLDVTDSSSVDKLTKDVGPSGVDVILNNTGIAWKGDAFDEEVAKGTLATNFWGTLAVTRSILPFLRQNGRVVNVSSTAGRLQSLSKKLQERFRDPSLSLEDLGRLMDKFVKDVAENCYAAEGWPRTAYGVSKVGVTAMTKVLAREMDKDPRGIKVVSCCPGWVRTSMAGPRAPLSPDEGADTPVYLSLAPLGSLVNGAFYSKRAVSDSQVGF